MSSPKKKKTDEKRPGELVEPTFSFLNPPANSIAFNLGAVAPDSEEGQPFVFGSSEKEEENGMSHTASISSLMEQRSKMANARRKIKNQDASNEATEAAEKDTKKPFVFSTDTTSTFDSQSATTEASSKAFVFSPGEGFSPGSSGSVARAPSSSTASRAQRRAGRGRRNVGSSSRNNASRVVSPSQASTTGTVASAAAVARKDTDDDDKKPSASASKPLVEQVVFDPMTGKKSVLEIYSDGSRRIDVEDGGEDDVKEPGSFDRAPSSVLQDRKVVHAKRDTLVEDLENIDHESLRSAEKAALLSLTNTLLNNAASRGDATTDAGGNAAASNSSPSAVARVVSEGDDDDDDDPDAMPPLEPAGKIDASNEPKEEANGESANVDDSDDADSRENPYAALMDAESSSEEEKEESSDEESEESDYNDEDSESECMCSECVAERFHRQRQIEMAKDAASDVDVDSDNQCCICFGSPTSSNRMAILPCCGSETGEDTSTVKFCNKCIVKFLKSQASEMESFFDYFIESDFIGECPRCRSLISVPRRGDPSRPNLVERPSFRQAVRHALQDQQKGMRPVLYTACCVYPNFMPVELFDGDEEKVKQLCRWGILKEVRKGEVYAIDPERQETLTEICEARFEDSEDDDDNDNNPFSTTTIITMRACVTLFLASFYAIMKFKIIVAGRMFNQGISMFMVGVKALPRGLNKRWQGMIVTCVNMLLLTMVLQLVFLLVAYIVIGYGTAKAVGWWLSTPNFKSFSRRLFYTWVVVAAMVGAYRVSKYDLLMYSSLAIGTFAGGCHVSGMSMKKALRNLWKRLP